MQHPDAPLEQTDYIVEAYDWLNKGYQLPGPHIDQAEDIIRGLLQYIEQLQKELIT